MPQIKYTETEQRLRSAEKVLLSIESDGFAGDPTKWPTLDQLDRINKHFNKYPRNRTGKKSPNPEPVEGDNLIDRGL